MEISPCHNSVAGHQIATNFCTCHDSTAVVPCAKFCSDHCIRIEMRANRIWIAMEKPLVKRAPGHCQPVSYIAAPDSARPPADMVVFTKFSNNILWPNIIRNIAFKILQHFDDPSHLYYIPLQCTVFVFLVEIMCRSCLCGSFLLRKLQI